MLRNSQVISSGTSFSKFPVITGRVSGDKKNTLDVEKGHISKS